MSDWGGHQSFLIQCFPLRPLRSPEMQRGLLPEHLLLGLLKVKVLLSHPQTIIAAMMKFHEQGRL